MPKAIERTFRGQIQLVVGERGEVLPYRHHTDRAHRSIGWYVRTSAHRVGCRCPYCSARGADLFLGYHLRDAIVEAELAAREHERER